MPPIFGIFWGAGDVSGTMCLDRLQQLMQWHTGLTGDVKINETN